MKPSAFPKLKSPIQASVFYTWPENLSVSEAQNKIHDTPAFLRRSQKYNFNMSHKKGILDIFISVGYLIKSNMKYELPLSQCWSLKRDENNKIVFLMSLVKIWALCFGLLLDIKFIAFPYLSIY